MSVQAISKQSTPTPSLASSFSTSPPPALFSASAMGQRAASSYTLPISSSPTSNSQSSTPPTNSTSSTPSHTPPDANSQMPTPLTAQTIARANSIEKSKPQSPRRNVISLYNEASIIQLVDKPDGSPGKNLRTTQVKPAKGARATRVLDHQGSKGSISPFAELDEPAFTRSPSLRQRHKLLNIPPPAPRITLRVRVIHTDATQALVVSPITLVGDVVRALMAQLYIEVPPASSGLQNRGSASLISPVHNSKPALVIPSEPGGDDIYMEESSPLGLYLSMQFSV